MSVSELKNRLLEVVRRVEKGEAFQITKGGKPVAILSPSRAAALPATGFARIDIKGSLEVPPAGWTYDIDKTTAIAPTPIIRGDLVFFAAGYGRGGALLKQVPKENGEVAIEEVYAENAVAIEVVGLLERPSPVV